MSRESGPVVSLPKRRGTWWPSPRGLRIPSWSVLVLRAHQLRAREARWPELGVELVSTVLLPRLLQIINDVPRTKPVPALVRQEERDRQRRRDQREAAARRRKLRRDAHRQRQRQKDGS